MREKVCAIEHTELAVHLQNDFESFGMATNQKLRKLFAFFVVLYFLSRVMLCYITLYGVAGVYCALLHSTHISISHARNASMKDMTSVVVIVIIITIIVVALVCDTCLGKPNNTSTKVCPMHYFVAIPQPNRNSIWSFVWSFLKCCADDCGRHNSGLYTLW